MLASKNLQDREWYTKFPWNLFERVTVEYGENQIRVPRATAGNTVLQYLQPSHGATLSVISYHFSLSEWGKDTNWYNWLLRQHRENDLRVRAVGGPVVEAKDSLEYLLEQGVLTELKILRSEVTSHLILLDPPPQLWVETYHTDGDAQDCYFTDRPYPETWHSAKARFKALMKSGEEYRQ